MKSDDIEIQKIKNFFNPANLLTKHLAEAPMMQCLEFLECLFLEGTHELAPASAGSNDFEMNLLYQCGQGLAEWNTMRHG